MSNPIKSDGTLWDADELQKSTEEVQERCGGYHEAKFDQGKVRYSLIDPKFLEDVAKVMTMGAEKYSEESWKSVPNAKVRYKDALWRHITSHGTDDESGISHLAHAACNLMFLHYLENKKDE